eukprot:2313377-Amphidinium_carterae.1
MEHTSDPDSPSGLCVKTSDGIEVWLPAFAVALSPVLQTLTSEELGQAGSALAPVSLSFSACTGRALQCLGSALRPGGLPLALRWDVGDRYGLTHAVDVLRCAQFLDIPLLVNAASCELAAIVVHTCPDADSIDAALTQQSAWQETLDAAADIDEWMLLAPALGARGLCLVKAWTSHHPAMAGLPSECFRDVLQFADQMVRSDAGVSELLQYMPEVGDEACTRTVSAAVHLIISHAVDVLHARHKRYRHSTLITAALAAHATHEYGCPELRVRMVRTLKEVAKPEDCVAVEALVQVLRASQYAGGLLLEGDPSQPAKLASSTQESPVAAAARRMGLDASWQVRVEACIALETLASSDMLEVIHGLVEAIDHGYFEVRQAAAHAIGRLASPGDTGAETALIRALGDDDWRVRAAAGEALACMVSQTEAQAAMDEAAAALIPL